MLKGSDMIVNLTNLPNYEINPDIKIKRAFIGDKDLILSFIKENFNNNWAFEAEHSLMQDVSKCFVAVQNGKILGFACYDAAAKGFFGPMGVLSSHRNKNIGKALLIRTLNAMKEYGYGYAIIGWVNDAQQFYKKTVNAEIIKNATPENSVYSNFIFM